MTAKLIWLGTIGPWQYDDTADTPDHVIRFEDLSDYALDGIAGGTTSTVRLVSAGTTTLKTESALFVTCSVADITINLITAVGQLGREYTIKKMDSTAWNVIIDPFGAQLIEGDSTFSLLLEGESVRIKSDGVGWYIV